MEIPKNNEFVSPQLLNTKKWYQRWWGRIFLLGIFLIAGLIAFTGYRVFYYVRAIQSGDFSVFKGEIVDVRQLGTPSQVNRLELETSDDPSYGAVDAKLTIVEFGDFNCPFCKENYPTVNKIREKYADKVRFIYRDFPVVDTHPTALIAAQAASCANEQGKFWQYHDHLYQNQDNFKTNDDLIGYAAALGLNQESFKNCLNGEKYHDEALIDLQDGIRFEVRGTPTFFFNGNRVAGVISENTFDQIIQGMLAKLP